jgi:hypothetical protein
MTLRLTKDIGFGASASAGSGSMGTITPTTSSSKDATVSLSHTYSGLSLGDDDGKGRVGIALGIVPNGALGTISSVSIVGSTATFSTNEIITASNGFERCSIYATSGVAGTSGDVVITNSANLYASFVTVFRLGGVSIAASTTWTDTNSNPATADPNVSAGGVAIAVVNHRSDVDETFSWSNLTEAFDVEYMADDQYGSSAYNAFASAQTNLAVSVTATQSGLRSPAMALAVFPAT